MSEIKKVARTQIEFDAQGLENGVIEFELEGEKWTALRSKTIRPHVRKLAEELHALREQYHLEFEETLRVIRAAGRWDSFTT